MIISKKIALVTGSTKGIGKAIAKQLVEAGMFVIVSAQSEVDQTFLTTEIGSPEQCAFFKVDISKKSELESLAQQIKAKYGKLDYLVANAGIMPLPCSIDTITEENVDRTINVNLKGTFWTLKILGDLIKETSSSGSIVALTSVDGLIGEPYGVIYSATKAGIISLTKSFARHFGESAIRVNAIAPGLIDTPLSASTGEDPAWTTELSIIKRVGQPDEIANMAVFLLSDKSSYITGQVMTVDGGFTLK